MFRVNVLIATGTSFVSLSFYSYETPYPGQKPTPAEKAMGITGVWRGKEYNMPGGGRKSLSTFIVILTTARRRMGPLATLRRLGQMACQRLWWGSLRIVWCFSFRGQVEQTTRSTNADPFL